MMIVYVLTNPAMPGLVKIGHTNNEDASARIAQLYTSGVPVPFNIEFACRVESGEEVEQALHIAFGPNRVNPRREFFEIEPEQAIALLRLLHKEDATTQVVQLANNVDEESRAAGERLRTRGPRLNFQEMGIPIGATLQSVDADATVTVAGTITVRLEGEEMSLNKATKRLLAFRVMLRSALHLAGHI